LLERVEHGDSIARAGSAGKGTTAKGAKNAGTEKGVIGKLEAIALHRYRERLMGSLTLRLSQKLNDKVKAGNLPARPMNENPFADWSAHRFFASRTPYVLFTNTRSFYSTVFSSGVPNDHRLIERSMAALREFMEAVGQAFAFHQFVAPASGTVFFAKALDRRVTGTMNDLVNLATHWLIETELSPFDVGFKINESPYSALDYNNPREAFRAMAAATASAMTAAPRGGAGNAV
jgi:hypothetical protein